MIGVPKPQHKRRVPKQSSRNTFPKSVRKAIYERDNGKCQVCGGIGTEIHHVMFRSRGGRGVETNGLTLCHTCHSKIHQDNELAEYWINVFADRYGPNFFRDEYDLERKKLNEVRKREAVRPNPQRNQTTQSRDSRAFK